MYLCTYSPLQDLETQTQHLCLPSIRHKKCISRSGNQQRQAIRDITLDASSSEHHVLSGFFTPGAENARQGQALPAEGYYGSEVIFFF